MASLFIGIGSNQGDKIVMIREAIREISAQIGKITRCSSIYESAAWGYQSDNRFYNLVIALDSDENPNDILVKLKQIETQFGRLPKKGISYEDRPIDLDILEYENHVLKTEKLEIPHPKIAERLFVLVPFQEIAPDWKFKANSKTVKLMLETCTDQTILHKLNLKPLEL
jgi:2-amino-4-hydroxy-6-hydroxymethyldihydropteridine diphosphokinase